MVDVDGGDPPEVSCDGVVAQDSVAVLGITIDGDAAATTHRVGLTVVVDELIVLDARADGKTLLVVAVASIFDDVVLMSALVEPVPVKSAMESPPIGVWQ